MTKTKEEIQEKAAWDYFFTGLTIVEIAEKYNIPKNSVSFYASKYPRSHFALPTDMPIERVVIIDEVELERAEALFKEFNIKYSIPYNFNLKMKFNSRL
jgi:hypothetical protein